MSTNPKNTIIQNLALIDDMDDLRDINEHFKTAWDRVRKQAVRAWNVGDIVEFDLKGGKVATGKVVKINRKTVGVEATHVDGGVLQWPQGYNVPGTMLRSAS